jgi:hypothetical protein
MLRTSHRFGAFCELPTATPAERFAETSDMHDLAIAQVEARVRRTSVAATVEEIDDAVSEWLQGGDPGHGVPRKLSFDG